MQSRIVWQSMNEVSRRKSTTKGKLKATNQQERIKMWKQHFENLLGNPLKVTHEPITRVISKQLDIKVDSILRKIKNRKAAGLDEIPPEVWKTRQFNDILPPHCNSVYNQNPIDRWMKGCILPFPKKGYLRLAKNYQSKTLTSIAAKRYNALLRNRIENPKLKTFLGRTKMDSGEIDPRPHKYWLSVKLWRLSGKKSTGFNIICRLYQGLWFHTQWEDGANSTRIRPTKINRRSHRDSLEKHKSESTFFGWRHRLLKQLPTPTTPMG